MSHTPPSVSKSQKALKVDSSSYHILYVPEPQEGHCFFKALQELGLQSGFKSKKYKYKNNPIFLSLYISKTETDLEMVFSYVKFE